MTDYALTVTGTLEEVSDVIALLNGAAPAAADPTQTPSFGGYQPGPPAQHADTPPDPWQQSQQTAPTQQNYGSGQGGTPQSQPAQQGPPNAPVCNHGVMRYVAAGFSRGSGKPYPAFYGCVAPQGAQDKCRTVPA